MSDQMKNLQVVLRSRPAGLPGPENFGFEETPVPQPGPGQVLLRTLWLSIEPYMLLGMKGAAPHMELEASSRLGKLSAGYLGGVELNAPMYGPTISEVVQSRHDGFAEGDLVVAYSGWQGFAVDDGSTLLKITDPDIPPTAWLGLLGIPGLTAYVGMETVARVKPGETVVVSAALGPVGSFVGQMAKIRGARAIGIASGDEKCRILVEKLGFDAAVDRRDPDFRQKLAAACPTGIDVYFENAGGEVWWGVFTLLNEHARIPICGLVAQYSGGAAVSGGDRSMELLNRALLLRWTLKGLYVFDHAELEGEFIADASRWLKEGRLNYFEDIDDGLHTAPDALLRVLQGRNTGKMLIRVGGAANSHN